MTPIAYPHPKNDEDFETLCLELFRAAWTSKDIERNGRRGHRQDGVDIFGHAPDGELRGVQCKLHEPPHELTEKEVRVEVDKAKGFTPPLGHYVVASTSKRNPKLQRLARQLTEEHKTKDIFSVQVCSWDDLAELLQSHPAIAERLLGPAVVATYQYQRDKIDQLVAIVHRTQHMDGHAEIDSAVTHLRKSPTATLALLEQLRQRRWDGLDARGRFRLLANLGIAASALDRVEEAGRYFIEARTHQPADDRAQALEALGYMYVGQRERAFASAARTLKSHPMQAIAASVLARSAPEGLPVSELIHLIPEALRRETDAAVALATRARLAGDFKAALLLLAPAMESDPKADVVVEEFARSTLGALFGEGGVITSEPMPRHQAEVRDVLERLTECLEKVPPEAFSRQTRLHLLRASAHARLGEAHAARTEVARAYSLDPNDESAAMQHALDEHEQGRTQQAIEVLRKAKAPKTRLLLAKYLRHVGGPGALDEARTTLLSIKTAIDEQDLWLKRIWANELVLLYTEMKQADDGLALLSSISEALPSSATNSLKAILFRAKGDQASEFAAVRAAFADLSTTTPWDVRRRIGQQLQSIGLFEEAFGAWRDVVRPNSLREDIQNYLYCATKAERDQDLLNFCKSARDEGFWIPEVVRTELSVLSKYNSTKAALELAHDFLKTAPEGEAGDEVRILLASMSARSGNTALAAELVTNFPPAERVSPHLGRGVVEVLRALDRLSEAATFAYDLVQMNPQDIDAHRAVLASIGLGGASPDLPHPSQVSVGVAVKYRENDTRKEAWCVIESALGSRSEHEFFGPTHPLSLALMGKSCGETFIVRKTALQERHGTVLELFDKRLWRFRDSFEKWEQRFPDDVTVQRFILPEVDDVKVQLAPMFRAADRRAETQDQAFGMYRSGRLPLHLLAKMSGCSVFEATMAAAAQADLPIHCCRGSEEERHDTTGVLLNASALALDSTALATLFLSGAGEVLNALRIPILVSEGTIEELKGTEVLAHKEGEPLSRLARVNGEYRLMESSPGQVAQMKVRLLAFIKHVEATCEIVPGVALAAVAPERREQLVSLLGREQAETLAIAAHGGAVLWSDDFLASIVANELMQCKRVWTQLVCEEEFRAGSIAVELYAAVVLGLFEGQYVYTWLTPEILVVAGRSCGWDFAKEGFSRMLEHFADPNVNASGLGILTLQTLSLLWNGTVLDEVAQAVTIKISRNLLKRKDGRLLLTAIRKNIRRFFGLNAVGGAKVDVVLLAVADT